MKTGPVLTTIQAITALSLVLSMAAIVNSASQFHMLGSRHQDLPRISFEWDLVSDILDQGVSDENRRAFVKEEIRSIEGAAESLRSNVMDVQDEWRRDSLYELIVYAVIFVGLVVQLLLVSRIKRELRGQRSKASLPS